MTTDQLISRFYARDVQLSAKDGQLRINAPRSELTSVDVETIRRHKADLLVILSGGAHGDGRDVSQAANEEYWSLVRQRDRNYLLSPRDWPTPCPWCGGRLIHSSTCDDLQIAWTPVIPFGKHRGQRASKVPATYITWILNSKAGDEKFRERLRRWAQTRHAATKTRSSSPRRAMKQSRGAAKNSTPKSGS